MTWFVHSYQHQFNRQKQTYVSYSACSCFLLQKRRIIKMMHVWLFELARWLRHFWLLSNSLSEKIITINRREYVNPTINLACLDTLCDVCNEKECSFLARSNIHAVCCVFTCSMYERLLNLQYIMYRQNGNESESFRFPESFLCDHVQSQDKRGEKKVKCLWHCAY